MSLDPVILLPLSPVRAPLLVALRQTLPKLRAAPDLDSLVNVLLTALRDDFHLPHVNLRMATSLEAEISLPGLSESGSKIAVPILDGSIQLGVIHAASEEAGRFGYDEEDALMILAAETAAAMRQFPAKAEDGADPISASSVSDTPLLVRHYPADDSVFIDDQYVIKGVAGAILWFLLGENARSGRVEFSNKELRLAPQIRLPAFSENLEARLILLRRRLAERSSYLAIEKAGRGRFRLNLSRRVHLVEVAS
jgi:adenylate cyclase